MNKFSPEHFGNDPYRDAEIAKQFLLEDYFQEDTETTELLARSDIRTLRDLANTAPEVLVNIHGIDTQKVLDFKKRAEGILEDQDVDDVASEDMELLKKGDDIAARDVQLEKKGDDITAQDMVEEEAGDDIRQQNMGIDKSVIGGYLQNAFGPNEGEDSDTMLMPKYLFERYSSKDFSVIFDLVEKGRLDVSQLRLEDLQDESGFISDEKKKILALALFKKDDSIFTLPEGLLELADEGIDLVAHDFTLKLDGDSRMQMKNELRPQIQKGLGGKKFASYQSEKDLLQALDTRILRPEYLLKKNVLLEEGGIDVQKLEQYLRIFAKSSGDHTLNRELLEPAMDVLEDLLEEAKYDPELKKEEFLLEAFLEELKDQAKEESSMVVENSDKIIQENEQKVETEVVGQLGAQDIQEAFADVREKFGKELVDDANFVQSDVEDGELEISEQERYAIPGEKEGDISDEISESIEDDKAALEKAREDERKKHEEWVKSKTEKKNEPVIELAEEKTPVMNHEELPEQEVAIAKIGFSSKWDIPHLQEALEEGTLNPQDLHYRDFAVMKDAAGKLIVNKELLSRFVIALAKARSDVFLLREDVLPDISSELDYLISTIGTDLSIQDAKEDLKSMKRHLKELKETTFRPQNGTETTKEEVLEEEEYEEGKFLDSVEGKVVEDFAQEDLNSQEEVLEVEKPIEVEMATETKSEDNVQETLSEKYKEGGEALKKEISFKTQAFDTLKAIEKVSETRKEFGGFMSREQQEEAAKLVAKWRELNRKHLRKEISDEEFKNNLEIFTKQGFQIKNTLLS